MKVLTLANEFPSFHPMRGKPTGFAEKFLRGEKLHTCRSNEKGFWKTGDIASVRRWTGKPYQSQQAVVAEPVALRVVPVRIECLCVVEHIYLKVMLGENRLNLDSRKFIRNDGLTVIDFLDWFFPLWKKEDSLVWCGSCVFFGEARYDVE